MPVIMNEDETDAQLEKTVQTIRRMSICVTYAIERLSECASVIRRSIDIAVAAGLHVCLYYIPLCILEDQKYAELCDKNRYRSDKEPDLYFDSSVPHGIVNMMSNVKGRNCINCSFDSRCDGVWDSYAKEFGFDDLHPIRIFANAGKDYEQQ